LAYPGNASVKAGIANSQTTGQSPDMVTRSPFQLGDIEPGKTIFHCGEQRTAITFTPVSAHGDQASATLRQL
jgi:hypothetical protein